MKSRIAILSLLLTGAAISASAQTKEHYYSEKAKDNIWFFAAGGHHNRTGCKEYYKVIHMSFFHNDDSSFL